MPETKVRSGQLVTTLSSKTIDATNTINTDLTKLAIAGGTAGQVLSTNGSGVLSFITASGGGGGAQVQVDTITTSGTWTKPAWGKYFKVYICGGGAGGGSGASKATTSSRSGGGGGGGSPMISGEFTDTQITGNQSVTIGAGGAGGASITTDGTNGNIGTGGGASSFGTLLSTFLSNGGKGGGTYDGSGGKALFFISLSIYAGLYSGGSQGRDTNAESRNLSSENAIVIQGGVGGGGGGGASANSTTTSTGATIDLWSTLFSVAPSSGGTNGGAGNNGVSYNYGFYTLGTSGGGGSYKTAQATGAGGNGSYGSGGGGGAASDNGHASGAGGNGGNGICIVVSIG